MNTDNDLTFHDIQDLIALVLDEKKLMILYAKLLQESDIFSKPNNVEKEIFVPCGICHKSMKLSEAHSSWDGAPVHEECFLKELHPEKESEAKTP